jgi:Trk-type K+ transport system membrane component
LVINIHTFRCLLEEFEHLLLVALAVVIVVLIKTALGVACATVDVILKLAAFSLSVGGFSIGGFSIGVFSIGGFCVGGIIL